MKTILEGKLDGELEAYMWEMLATIADVSENGKLIRYRDKGDHLPAEKILEYFRKRGFSCTYPGCLSPHGDRHYGHCPNCGVEISGIESGAIPAGDLVHVCGGPDQIV